MLAPLMAEGWRLRHSLPYRRRGDIDEIQAFVPEELIVMGVGADAREEACREGAAVGCGVGDGDDAEIAALTPNREVTIGCDVAEANDCSITGRRH